MPGSEEKLDALLSDLRELTTYLHGRGDKTLTLSRQFERLRPAVAIGQIVFGT